MDETIGPMAQHEQAYAGGHDRRNFFRLAGLGGAAIALAACGADPSRITQVTQTAGTAGAVTPAAAGGATVTLDFSSDFGVLNYAYALEQLESAFYARVLASPQFGSIFSATEQRVLTDLRDHEAIHAAFLRTALDGNAIQNLTPNFSNGSATIDFSNRVSVLNAAVAFEDTGVSAYNGAAQYIKNATYLGLAGKIVSVEARHASAIHDLLSPRGASFAPNVTDNGAAPTTVVGIANQYLVENLTVINS